MKYEYSNYIVHVSGLMAYYQMNKQVIRKT